MTPKSLVNSLDWINFESRIPNEENVIERMKDLRCSSLMPVYVVKFSWRRSSISIRFIASLWTSFIRVQWDFIRNQSRHYDTRIKLFTTASSVFIIKLKSISSNLISPINSRSQCIHALGLTNLWGRKNVD